MTFDFSGIELSWSDLLWAAHHDASHCDRRDGVVGSAVADALVARGHEVLRASRRGAVSVDIADPKSIAAMYEAVG